MHIQRHNEIRRLIFMAAGWILTTFGLAVTSALGNHKKQIPASELFDLRGSSQAAQSTGGVCDSVNSSTTCSGAAVNDGCSTCSKTYFTKLLVTAGNKMAGTGAGQDCGSLYAGKCQTINGTIQCNAPKTGGMPNACGAGDPSPVTQIVPNPPG